jgi:hypothetical protein
VGASPTRTASAGTGTRLRWASRMWVASRRHVEQCATPPQSIASGPTPGGVIPGTGCPCRVHSPVGWRVNVPSGCS